MSRRSLRRHRKGLFDRFHLIVLIGLLSAAAGSLHAQTAKTRASNSVFTATAQSPDTARTREEWRAALTRLPKPKTGCYTSAFPIVEWKPTPCGPAPSYPVQSTRTQSAQLTPDVITWRRTILRLRAKKAGCYTASFPRTEWISVACAAPPPYPIIPRSGPGRRFVVGGNTDYAAQTNPAISAVEGSFPSVSAGITESGPIANSGPSIADAYTLQINTNTFTSTACSGSPNAGCRGWEQFVYENNNVSHRVFIQYWLLDYNAACPAGWTQFSFTGSTTIYCYQSTTTASLPAGQPANTLGTMTMSASANTGADQVTITAGANAASRVGLNAVALSAGWTDSEFNVFGDGGNSSGGGAATFSANSTITVREVIHNGTTNAPPCVMEGFTGETNSLTLVGAPVLATQPSPTIEFTESNIAGTPASCVSAAGVGDTHLSTFGGLFYDFQASGDFILAQTGRDFVVQARQVSGAPTWPNASINKAVAARMGANRLAVCLAPERLVINGKTVAIENGKILSLPAGVDVLHTGNAYLAVDPHGNSLRAEANGTYINATVGLGRWPTAVQGILVNVPGHVNQIATRTGTILTNPFPFEQLYHAYADSWNVRANESVLADCDPKVSVLAVAPTATFYAANLPTAAFTQARSICVTAGVKTKVLLDACTLDVAVIGKASAAKVFVGLRPPRAVGLITYRRDAQQQSAASSTKKR